MTVSFTCICIWISGDRGKICRADVDDGVFDFLCTIPLALVEKAVGDAVELDVSKIQNKSAYLMGVLKHKVSELSADPASLVTGPGRGGGGRGGREGDGRVPTKRGACHVALTPTAATVPPVEKIDIFSNEPLKRKRGGKVRPDLAAPSAAVSVETAPAAEIAHGKIDFFSNEPLKRKRGGKARPDLVATSSSVEVEVEVETKPSEAAVVATAATAESKPSSLADWDAPLPRKRGGRARAESNQ